MLWQLLAKKVEIDCGCAVYCGPAKLEHIAKHFATNATFMSAYRAKEIENPADFVCTYIDL